MRFLLFGLLLLSGCALFHQKAPASPSGPDKVVAQIGDAQTKANIAVGANAEGTKTVAATLPDSPSKSAINFFQDATLSVVGEPDLESKAKAVALAQSLISENAAIRAQADKSAQAYAAENAGLKGQIEALKNDYIAALAKQKADYESQIQAARQAGIDRERRLVTWIFFGGGALLVAGGVAILLLASSYPLFGPKAGFAVSGSGAVLVLIGMAYQFIDAHPAVLWCALSLAAVLVAGAVALLYANHKHAQAAPAK